MPDPSPSEQLQARLARLHDKWVAKRVAESRTPARDFHEPTPLLKEGEEA